MLGSVGAARVQDVSSGRRGWAGRASCAGHGCRVRSPAAIEDRSASGEIHAGGVTPDPSLGSRQCFWPAVRVRVSMPAPLRGSPGVPALSRSGLRDSWNASAGSGFFASWEL